MTMPRWKSALESSLAKYPKANIFQLATTSESGQPHVRSCVFRSFLAPASTPNSPVILTTTDIRTPKVQQILYNKENISRRVELAWWIEGSQEQFRIEGRVSLIPSPNSSLYQTCMDGLHESPTKAEIYQELEREGLDWEKKRIDVFKSLSPSMRASWCRPVPGSQLMGGYDGAKEWPERLEEPNSEDNEKAIQDWSAALKNFALVLIEPSVVDYVELGVVPNRRTMFARAPGNVQWQEYPLVP